MPAVGHRALDSGALNGQGSWGTYWSSTVHSSNIRGYDLHFNSGISRTDFADEKTHGLGIRCVRKLTFFLPAVGGRNPDDASLVWPGAAGYYWSSTSAGSGSNAYLLRLGLVTGSDPVTIFAKGYALTIRCVR